MKKINKTWELVKEAHVAERKKENKKELKEAKLEIIKNKERINQLRYFGMLLSVELICKDKKTTKHILQSLWKRRDESGGEIKEACQFLIDQITGSIICEYDKEEIIK